MKKRVLLLCLPLVFLSCAASFASAQGCTRIDSSQPAQVLSYELLEGKPENTRGQVILRFRNNSDCYVTVLAHEDPRDLRALLLIRRQDGPPILRVAGPEDLPDGRRIALDYDVQYLQPLPPPRKIFHVDSVVYTLRVGPGTSYIFGVPLSSFDYLNRIRVPFRYDWDSQFGAPSHDAVFYSEDLPIEILRKTQSKKPPPSQIEKVAANRAWPTFYRAFRAGVNRRDRSALIKMMPDDFSDGGGGLTPSGWLDFIDENAKNGSWRDLQRSFAAGTVIHKAWTREGVPTRVTKDNGYYFEFRKDRRWYFAGVVGD